jgi:hypothetical protein
MADEPHATQSTVTPAVDNQPDAQNGGTSESSKTRGPKPAKILPTDRIRFDKQTDILRAFAAVSGHEKKAVTAEEVGTIVKMAGSTIGQITPFFVDAGLIARAGDKKSDAKGFIPAPEVMAYQKAYEWDKANAAKKLAPVFVNSWFATALAPKLKFRPVNEKEAINDLGEMAAVGPDKEDAIRILLDYLVISGLADRDSAGMLRSGSVETLPGAGIVPPVPSAIPPPPPPTPGVAVNVSDHQLWLIEILNTYPDDVLDDTDQEAILKLIKKIKGIGKKNIPPVTAP